MKKNELLEIAKPILFNTEMVKAILEGRKTVTRRAIKLDLGLADTDKNDSSYLKIPDEYGDYHHVKDLCRYQVEDILYVRETFNDEETYTTLFAADKDFIDRGCKKVDDYLFMESEIRWKPSIHMPKKLARIFLKVTDVRVERLQDMDPYDAIKEGIDETHDLYETALSRFKELWDSTIKKSELDKYGWGANPWVWVIEFEKLEVE